MIDGLLESRSMSRISKEQDQRLRKAIAEHDFLHRILRHIESLLRVVFHGQKFDWSTVRAAAEEILMADILTRHGGNIDGVYFTLRKSEQGGHAWEQAIRDYATYCHNYFTTPLGIVMRRDYFGEGAHFVSQSAREYAARFRETATAPAG
jgi:hypothetical protein